MADLDISHLHMHLEEFLGGRVPCYTIENPYSYTIGVLKTLIVWEQLLF